MPTGKVRFYIAEKGFGFVIPDEGGPDVFLYKIGARMGRTPKLRARSARHLRPSRNDRTGTIAATNLKLEEKAA